MSGFIIKNARIADGLDGEPFMGSVVVRDGVITEVSRGFRGSSIDIAGLDVVDADGLVLAPGFIDVHGHSDISILAAPESEGKISQGITTEICGNCGLSAFPVSELNRTHLNELFDRYGIPLDWNSYDGYAKKLAEARPALNIASLCGHNTLRASIMGYDARIADECEIRAMREALTCVLGGGEGRPAGECSIFNGGNESGGRGNTENPTTNIQQPTTKEGGVGVLGFSTGLLYSPGNSAERAELLALGEVVGKHDVVWATHLRSEGRELLEALDEFIEIGAAAGCRKLHVSHLKTAGTDNWWKLDEVLVRISHAESEHGIRITADRYPYTESMTSLSAFVPSPYSEMDDSSLKRLLDSKEEFARFADRLREMPSERWETLRVVSTSANPAPANFADSSELRGENFAELADASGIPAPDLCAELLRLDPVGTMAASKGMSEENMRRILALPYVCCCTDETARPADFSLGASHPRGYGAFPRFMSILASVMPIGAIIRKMTSLPAQIFGLKGRGAIRPGFAADLVLLDFDAVIESEPANFADPHKKSSGIKRIWVNGATNSIQI